MATPYNSVLDPNKLNNQNQFPPFGPISTSQTQSVNSTIPGFNGLNRSATGVIGSLLNGLPSGAPTQRANAYFGASSGMPGSDFVRNRGFDLYGEKADQYKQRGIDDFLKLITGYSGTVMPTAGQNIESQQFSQNLEQQRRQQQANDEMSRRNQAFSEYQYGLGRPYSSSPSGNVTDRGGAYLHYDPAYNTNQKPYYMR